MGSDCTVLFFSKNNLITYIIEATLLYKGHSKRSQLQTGSKWPDTQEHLRTSRKRESIRIYGQTTKHHRHLRKARRADHQRHKCPKGLSNNVLSYGREASPRDIVEDQYW